MTKKKRSKRSGATTRASGNWFKLGIGLSIAAAVLLILGLATVWVLLPGPTLAKPAEITLERDVPLGTLCDRLGRSGLVSHPTLFQAYLGLMGLAEAIQPGAHHFAAAVSPRDLARCLTRSPLRPKVSVTVPEGYDHFRLARRLDAAGVVSSQELLKAAEDPAVLREAAISAPNAEGYFFPLTYQLYIDTDAKTLVLNFAAETRVQVARITKQYSGAWAQLREVRGWGENEVLTLASIIEKESADPDEQRLIAGVFFNRLDSTEFRPRRMLQSDPTAYYGCLVSNNAYSGCQDNPGRVVAAMLRDSSNPYNTYRHAGLPPGPISNPGETAIAAVVNPEASEYLFFVAKAGKHQFSRTLGEHEAKTHAP